MNGAREGRAARVSVVIPAYNSAATIGEAIDSACAQTRPAHEIIVVDDGSRDDTAAVVARDGDRVRLVRQANRGIGGARNRGARESSGDWLVFLDADDVLEPDALATQLAVAMRHPNSVLVGGDGEQFAGEDVVSPTLIGGPLAARLAATADGELTGDCHLDVIAHNPFTTPGQVLIPRASFERVGGFLERRLWSEDWDMWLHLAKLGPITAHRGRVLRYRQSATSLSGAHDERNIRWSIWRVPVIRAHLRDAARVERAALLARLDAVVREGSREAYYLGRHRDRARALGYLWRLWMRAPWYFEPARNFVALLLPDRLASLVSRAMRRRHAPAGEMGE